MASEIQSCQWPEGVGGRSLRAAVEGIVLYYSRAYIRFQEALDSFWYAIDDIMEMPRLRKRWIGPSDKLRSESRRLPGDGGGALRRVSACTAKVRGHLVVQTLPGRSSLSVFQQCLGMLVRVAWPYSLALSFPYSAA